MKKFTMAKTIVSLFLAIALTGIAGPAFCADEPDIKGAPEKIKIGVVTFLSGPASSPFGIPGRNSARVMVDTLNQGEVPAPYDKHKGIGGVPIEIKVIDEAGGADAQVSEYRRMVLDEEVDLVIGYISSADALAVAPVAEELKTLTIIYDAGTNRLFEEDDFEYVFRTKAHQIIDSVGAAKYIMERFPEAKTIAGINQDYAWGHDNWKAFKASMKALNPDIEVSAELFPEIYSGDYSAEISSLLRKRPDIIHTSLWGGDLEGFLIQAMSRGLHEQSTIVATCGDPILPRLEGQLNEGIVIGARGPHGSLGPRNDFDKWFREAFRAEIGERPVYPAYHMAQAFLGVKNAYEKALAKNDSKKWPDMKQVREAMKNSKFETPSGEISLSIGGGHQGVEPSAYGITTGDLDSDTGEVILKDKMEFPVEEVNPPDGVDSLEWIESGFER
ncbi:MAG: ABC transporter substrate-binding protein [Desulfosalsimonadaceae bacterium]